MYGVYGLGVSGCRVQEFRGLGFRLSGFLGLGLHSITPFVRRTRPTCISRGLQYVRRKNFSAVLQLYLVRPQMTEDDVCVKL